MHSLDKKGGRRRNADSLFSFLLIAGLLAFAAITAACRDKRPTVIGILPGDTPADLAAKAARVVPSERQLAWQALEFQAFFHFGVNTFTDREWGTGTEDPKIFNPTEFDAGQWIAAVKAAGIRGVIVTAKHHDGFCLWPSRFTEHSVKNSQWRNGRGDVVREVADACRRAGLKFGVYLSPWDRHEPTYGDSPRYNEHFKNQLRELLTGYGEIAEVWFDGACGEGPNGKRQVYDWQAYWDLIRELQPGAVISIMGPDVRWVGNEAGTGREIEWSVIPVPGMADRPADKDPGVISGLNAMTPDLGSLQAIEAAARRGGRLIWYPAQVDVSIRPGWFYHASEDMKVKTLGQLLDIYYAAVGGNAQLLLNIPPDRRGRIHENDVLRLKELGDALRTTFTVNLASGAKVSSSEYDLRGEKAFNTAMIKEPLRHGQRIESFAVDAWDGGGWREIAKGTTVGWTKLLRFPVVRATKVRLRILKARAAPDIPEIGLYLAPLLAP